MKPTYQFHYETQANFSYLVAILQEGAKVVDYQVKMMENNSIANLLELHDYCEDGEIHLCYNVTSRLALSQVLERQKMKKEEFLTLLLGIIHSYREALEYQLPNKGILLDEAYIFVKPGSFEPEFAFLPLYTENNGLENVCHFVQRMVLESRIANTNDDFIQRLLELVNTPQLTVDQIEEKLECMRSPAKENSEPKFRKVIEASLKPPEFTPDSVSIAPSARENVKISASAENAKDSAPKSEKEVSHVGKRMVKKEKKNDSSPKSIAFVLLQGVFVLLLALAVKSGFLIQPDGSFNFPYLGGLLLAGAGIDFVVYREMFVNNKGEKKKKNTTQAKKIKKSGKNTKPGQAKKKASSGSDNSLSSAVAAKPEPQIQSVPVSPPVPVSSYIPPEYVPHEATGEKTVLMEDGTSYGRAYLEYYENGLAMRIHLDQDVVRVGSWERGTDHVLNSRKISKTHAEFIRRENRYYVCDLNSTNGTYLNDSSQRMVSNEPVELHAGDRVRLADLELVFKC